MTALLLLVLFCLFFLLSLRLRLKNLRQTVEMAKPIASPLSSALTELVSTAGGIYLSLILLASFLKIELPATLYFYGITLDPLAFISLLVTVVQPLFFSFFNKE